MFLMKTYYTFLNKVKTYGFIWNFNNIYIYIYIIGVN
jgi:hypothetical protein